jgi:hypothetical protein
LFGVVRLCLSILDVPFFVDELPKEIAVMQDLRGELDGGDVLRLQFLGVQSR